MAKPIFGTTIPDALDVPFDGPNCTPPMLQENVQDAICYLNGLVEASSRAFTFASYNGKANAGRYLEFWNNISSDDAPVVVIGELKVLTIVIRTTAADATADIGWYDVSGGLPGVLLHTTSMVAQKEVIESGTSASPVFTLPPSGKLAIQVISGSINSPHLYFTGQGG